ncbi:unnamed protein product [Staurois parvus]|uniref:Uncharacterized protein n=1 Tax=Staurois parvus TaxID=386267 RepID=A0ABN9AJ01_9NEOB|nr:unnamed protein product [Staurois parvus]
MVSPPLVTTLLLQSTTNTICLHCTEKRRDRPMKTSVHLHNSSQGLAHFFHQG